MLDMLKLAGEIAMPTIPDDPRNFWLGCVGIRKDGVRVTGKNGAVMSTVVDNYQLIPNSHAEGRVIRKLGRSGIVYVTRIARKNKGFAMARPCGTCQARLKAAEVERVYYTINPEQYGIWFPTEDLDKVFYF